jgi:hypothetical protein
MRRRAFVLLPTTFLALGASALVGGTGHVLGTYAGAGLGLLANLFTPLLVWAIAAALGCRTTRADIGIGAILRSRVTPGQVIRLHAIPLGLRIVHLPARQHFARDMRILMAVTILAPAVLALPSVAFAPAYVAVAAVIVGFGGCLANAVSSYSDSPRTLGARAFHTVPVEQDALLGEPQMGDLLHALDNARFGDIEAAADALPPLRGNRFTSMGASNVESIIGLSRGDYAAAMRGSIARLKAKRTTAAAAQKTYRTECARMAHLAMLIAERDPTNREQSIAFASKRLEEYGASETSAETVPARALLRLERGSPEEAHALCSKQQSAAATPVDLADALCSRARAEAATGQGSKAVRTLSRAARITPWYARVAIVRQILGAAAPIPDLPSIDVAAESRLFDDPWAAPET